MANTRVEGLQQDKPAPPAGLGTLPRDSAGTTRAKPGAGTVQKQLIHSGTDEAHALDVLRRCVSNVNLDLTGLVVAGAVEDIAVTAAALAGAERVIAIRRKPKKRSPIGEALQCELPMAELANLAGQIKIVTRMDSRAWQDVDVLVNSPDLGPISHTIVELLPSRAVVALMAECWEIPAGLVDIDACHEAGIKVAALNLRHPTIRQLPELAQLCCRLASNAGLHLRSAKIAVLCDTPCSPFIERMFAYVGANVRTFPHPLLLTRDDWDAVVVALRPSEKPPMDIHGLAAIKENARSALLVQFSGEIDRVAARYFGLELWPHRRPPRGHLGLPLETLGPTSVFRRAVGGLKAAECVCRCVELGADAIGFVVDRSREMR